MKQYENFLAAHPHCPTMSATDTAVAWRLKVAEMTEQKVNSFIEFLNERRDASSRIELPPSPTVSCRHGSQCEPLFIREPQRLDA